MNKHTPGPWRVNAPDYVVSDADGLIEGTKQTVCRVGNSNLYDTLLIAAAPDMLQTLMVISRYSSCPDSKEMADLAIAKATKMDGIG